MLKHHARLLVARSFAIDVAALTAAFLTAYWVRDSLLPFVLSEWFPGPLFELSSYMWVYGVTLPIWIAALAFFRLYHPSRLATFRRMPVDIIKASAIGLAILMGLTYALKAHDVSRSFVSAFGVASIGLLIGGRLLLRNDLRRHGRPDYALSNVLVVGTGEKAQNFADLLNQNRKWGLHLIGMIAENRFGTYPVQAGKHSVIGNLDDLEWICHKNVIDEVIFVVPGKILSDMEDLFLLCEELGVNARIAVGIFPHLIARATLEDFSNIPLLTFSTKPTNWAALMVKRILDVCIAWSVLILAMPLWLLTAIMIKLDSAGPIFFCQERCGLNGRRFTMYKFRSMVADAELRIEELSTYNELVGPVFKIKNDPRVTRVGKLLRKTSLDEIPQLLNVIKGDMSIIGPRPAIPAEVDKYERWQRRRLSMKPGLTSLWVVRGRNDIPFEQWMQFDLEYIDKWSLELDAKILLQTIPVVLTGRGAS
jgi:exopolysaccharide biosynthesis polyprenyl glycosylphosphotransferase